MSWKDTQKLEGSPCLASDDAPHRGALNAELPRNLYCGQPASSDCGYVLGFEFRPNGLMALGVQLVFVRRSPSDVIRAVVEAIAVIVRGVVLGCWLGSAKSFRDKDVNRASAGLPAATERDGKILSREVLPKDATRTRACPTYSAADAPNARDFVFGRVSDGTPFFIGVRGSSHCELILRCGQGRGGVTAPFRPAAYSRFTEMEEAA